MTTFVLALLLAGAGEPVKPKMPLGKDTTVAEGPLTADGYIDYGKALQERLGKGVTAETNAVVLLWQASGPKPEGGNGMHPDFFKALQMAPPPEQGDYIISSGKFALNTLKLKPMEMVQFDDEMQKLSRQPWSENDHPNVAALLNANAKPLTLVAEASKRRDYFNPLVSSQKEGEPNMLIGALLPQVQKCRECVYYLSIRTMLRLHEKNYDAAWQDIMTMQRLARLMSRGATLIEYLVAVAIEAISHQTTHAYLEHAPLTAAQVQAKWKEIETLPPMDKLWTKIDIGERFMYLDCMQMTRRGQMAVFLDKPKKATDIQMKALESIDWAPILRDGNQWYDRMVAAAKLPTRAERKKAFDEIGGAMKKKKAEFKNNTMAHVFAALDLSGVTQMKQAAQLLIGLLMPAVEKVQQSEDRRNQSYEHLRIAFALVACKADMGKYPAKLEDLAPKYLAKLPEDSFADKPLNYTTDGNTFKLWSVGLNGKDDNGNGAQDEPKGDDLTITLPRIVK